MGKYLKKFETTSQYNAYTADTANFIKPNVSLITETNTVEYNPWVETMVVAKYNVTESTKTQMILGFRQTGPSSTGVTTAFTSVYVDGNEIEISNANVNYTFDTVGEHTVKYELKDPTTINEKAFNGILNGYRGVSAVSITIPDSVTSIGNQAFQLCSGLTSCTIGSGVISIGNLAFYGCTSLTSIAIPDSVTSIGSQAFYNCTSLTSVTIGNSVTSINGSAFNGCYMVVSNFINNSSLDAAANNYWGAVVYDFEIDGLCIRNNSVIKYRCNSSAVTIPDSVTSIGNTAFQGCTSLTSCTIGSGVISIGNMAFENCSGLTSVTIGNSVTSINGGAFYYCSSLSEITSNAMTAPTIPTSGQPAFGVASSGTLKVPTSSTGYDAWLTKLGSGWSIQYI